MIGRQWQGALGLLVASTVGCSEPKSDESESSVVNGPSVELDLYDRCDAPCGTGECVSFPEPLEKFCSVPCETAADCPALTESQLEYSFTDVLCVHSRCRPVRCEATERDHNRLVSSGLLCFRGEITPCGTLSPTPCTCGCADDSMCNEGNGECVPKFDVNENCNGDDMCASGFCDPTQTLIGTCALPPDSPCTNSDQCHCRTSPDGSEGYCGAHCGTYCGPSGCYGDCETKGFWCMDGNYCYKECTGDADCRDWETCSFESVEDLSGGCVTRR